jgi:NADP-dependent 3-hydroxy acid dehydrogenase YdfG
MFDDLFSIRGKVALVTGGSRGIGEMIAAGFLAHGAKVYISARKADACNATAARLSEQFGGSCISVPADLSQLDGVKALAQAIGEAEPRLDILVNNAGVSWGAPLEEFPENGWDKVMDTNVKGVFFLTQRLLPLLQAAATDEAPARVINIGSIDGIKTPRFETFSYGASKAAVHHLTRIPGQRDRAGPLSDLHAEHRRGWSGRRRRRGLGAGGSRQSARPRGHAAGYRRAGDLSELAGGRIHRRRGHHLRRRIGRLVAYFGLCSPRAPVRNRAGPKLKV